MKKLALYIPVMLALVFIASACSPGTSSPAPASTTTVDGATLVQERCSVCHPLARIESTNHTAAEWKAIVDTMISRGAQLTPQEETTVINYLATNFGN